MTGRYLAASVDDLKRWGPDDDMALLELGRRMLDAPTEDDLDAAETNAEDKYQEGYDDGHGDAKANTQRVLKILEELLSTYNTKVANRFTLTLDWRAAREIIEELAD